MANVVRHPLKQTWQNLHRQDSNYFFLVLACVSTIFCFGLADIIFGVAEIQFSLWRQVRTEFAFQLPSHNIFTMIVCVFMSSISLIKRQWIIPFLIGLILSMFSYGGYSFSGPGYLMTAVEPLLNLHYELILFAYLLNAYIIATWVSHSKRARLKEA